MSALHCICVDPRRGPVPTLDLLTYRRAAGHGRRPSSARGSSCRSARARSPASSSRRTSTQDAALDGKDAEERSAGARRRAVRAVRTSSRSRAGRRSTTPPAPGEAITAVLPPKTRGERADAHKTRRVVSITAAGLELAVEPVPRPCDLRRREATFPARDARRVRRPAFPLLQLAAQGMAADTSHGSRSTGLVTVRQDRVDRDPFEAASLSAAADRRVRGG